LGVGGRGKDSGANFITQMRRVMEGPEIGDQGSGNAGVKQEIARA